MALTNPPVFVVTINTTKPISDAPSTWPKGLWPYSIYSVSGYPSAYGALYHFGGNAGNAATQIYQAWDFQSAAGGTTALFTRSNRDVNDTFGSFQPILLGAQNATDGLLQTGSYTASNQSYTGGTFYYHTVNLTNTYKANPKVQITYGGDIITTTALNFGYYNLSTSSFRIWWSVLSTTTFQPVFSWQTHGEG